MIRNLSILVVLFAVISGYTWYDDYHHQKMASAPAQKNAMALLAAPDFTFGRHVLSDFKDKAIVLNFWASWCAPCVTEFPAMLQLAKNTPDVVFIFLSLDEDEKAMKRFLKKMKIEGKNIFIERDKDQSIAHDLYQTYKLPETYLIAPDLEISEKIIGGNENWSSAEMQEKLRNLSQRSISR